MLTVIGVFAIAGTVAMIAGAMGKCPWWVSVGCLCVCELLRILPVGR
jgi:hypothetical protein